MRKTNRRSYFTYPSAPMTNRPHLRLRRDEHGTRVRRAVFHASTGYCPWQIKRLVKKIAMSSMYGKFGTADKSRTPMSYNWSSRIVHP